VVSRILQAHQFERKHIVEAQVLVGCFGHLNAVSTATILPAMRTRVSASRSASEAMLARFIWTEFVD
jgi:hypothetical protein